jgi:pyruvate dehydrogenase E2 component (dihydrolipoamide acetyltransferase)
MANETEIKVPDIGGANQVDVIEILVKAGDKIDVDTPLITLESDKASMEIPSPLAGTVSKISVKTGDKVSEGDLILWVSSDKAAEAPKAEPVAEKSLTAPAAAEPVKTAAPVSNKAQTIDVAIPDIGGATDVDVIDVLVKPGMVIEKDQALATLEGDKATMDIPSPYAGTVKEVKIKLGDKVSQGTPLVVLDAEISNEASVETIPAAPEPAPAKEAMSNTAVVPAKSETLASESDNYASNDVISAGPAVRRLARELGVELTLVKGSGRKTRITKEDIQNYVKARLSEKPAAGGFNLPSNPVIDFSKFGEIETKPLNKIKKLTGANVHRSWISIPHVTQFDEADITDLEAFRKSETEQAKSSGFKLTILAFVCKAVSKALQVYPQFNASLDASGEQLIYKKYFNIGIAVETPNGLVVPVIKNTNQLTVGEIAQEMAKLSTKARDKGLMPADMSGGCFTISSLGGIGGTAFTPIVNSPEVAILGLSRSSVKPVYDHGEFKPRLMLPLSLSYDHRVIDGAEAARFTRLIGDYLSDIRKVLL